MTDTKMDLPAILEAHAKWVKGEEGGVRANLVRANLDGANLYGANLDGANLYGANLGGANLDGANLYGANLYGANLYGANLYGANLVGANLYGANLDGANLGGANLCGANLYGANLGGANLYGANLYGANLDGASGEKMTLIGKRPVLCIGPLGSRQATLMAFLTNHGVYVRAGCFWNTVEMFEEAVTKRHDGNEHGKEYAAAITLIKVHAELWTPAKTEAVES